MNLRELTAEKHIVAESMPFNKLIMSGEITPDQYGMYLRSQLEIFSTIENTFGLPNIDMARVDAVLDDLTELGIADLTAPGYRTKEYCDYIKELDSNMVLPHIYLNYMAVMMGGQIIRKNVPGAGKMYDFGNSEKISKYVAIIRELQSDDWASEVNCAYDYIISILNELQELTQ